MYKNVAGQEVSFYAWDSAAGGPKTGDAANITIHISLDNGATATSTNSVTEVGGGLYAVALTQAETNADLVSMYGVSVTADVDIDPLSVFTTDTDLFKADLTSVAKMLQYFHMRNVTLRKDVAGQKIQFLIIDRDSGFVTDEDPADISVTLFAAGAGSGVASTNSVTEATGGLYELELTQAETNYDFTLFSASSSSGADRLSGYVWIQFTDDDNVKADLTAITTKVDDILDDTSSTLPGMLLDTRRETTGILKNTAGQTVGFHFTATDGNVVTGDEANLTVLLSGDGAAWTPVTNSPVETTNGFYTILLTQAETNYQNIRVYAFSSTSATYKSGVLQMMTLDLSDPDFSDATLNAIADGVLGRGVGNIEDSADSTSLVEMILGAFESATSGTTWTIRKTDGGMFSTRTVSLDANAAPIVGVS